MMKRKFIVFIILLILNNLLYSQVVGELRRPASSKAIPSLVLEAFKIQYPDVLVKSWYVTHITYWYNDMSSGWYTNWHGNRRPVVYTYEQPNYFEVEFIDHPGELSRAIYNVYAYWYETRTQLNGLPMVLLESLKETKYAEWKRSRLSERIESAEWPETNYRFEVTNGLKSVIIRMNSQGEIIQAKMLAAE